MNIPSKWTLLLLYPLIACSPALVAVSKAGRKIKLIYQEVPTPCQPVGTVFAHPVSLWYADERFSELALRQLRNQAGQTNATHLKITSQLTSAHRFDMSANLYNCPEPVSMDD